MGGTPSLTRILVFALCAATGSVFAQKVSYRDSGSNTASKADVSVSYGGSTKYPRNYNYYYYNRNYQPARYVQPVATPVPPPRVLGPVKKYSDLEYSDLVLSMLNSGNEPGPPAATPETVTKSPTPAPTMTVTVNQPTPKPDKMDEPVLQSATVTSVEDRGVLVTADGRRIRMRGVAFATEQSKNDIRRKFAVEAREMLDNLVKNQTVYFVVEKPEKGLDGSILAIVHLRDGTEVNRLALESGMAIISPSEFANESDADRLIAAEADARKKKHGIWKVW